MGSLQSQPSRHKIALFSGAVLPLTWTSLELSFRHFLRGLLLRPTHFLGFLCIPLTLTQKGPALLAVGPPSVAPGPQIPAPSPLVFTSYPRCLKSLPPGEGQAFSVMVVAPKDGGAFLDLPLTVSSPRCATPGQGPPDCLGDKGGRLPLRKLKLSQSLWVGPSLLKLKGWP